MNTKVLMSYLLCVLHFSSHEHYPIQFPLQCNSLGYNPHLIGNCHHVTGYKLAAAFAPLFPSLFCLLGVELGHQRDFNAWFAPLALVRV